MLPTATEDCPRCGAPRPHTDDDEAQQDCTYCGAALPKRVMAPVPAPIPHQAARFPKLTFVAPVVAVAVLALIGAVSAWQSSAPSARRPPTAEPPQSGTSWSSEPSPSVQEGSELERAKFNVLPGLLLMPAPGEAEERVVLLLQPREAGGSALLAALDTATGRVHWDRTIDTPNLTDVRAGIGKMLIVATSTSISGIEPASGEIRWQRPLTHAPGGLCAADSWVGVGSAKGVSSAFVVSTGQPITPDARKCKPVYSSRSAAPNFDFVENQDLKRVLPKGSKLHALRGLLPQRGTGQVVLGREGNASGRSSVGLVSGRTWLWQANLAVTLSEKASFLEPPLASVRLERVVVPYLSDGVKLAAFNLKSGDRIWTTRIEDLNPKQLQSSAQLLVSLDGHVLLAGEGKLWALNLTDGNKVWSIGEP